MCIADSDVTLGVEELQQPWMTLDPRGEKWTISSKGYRKLKLDLPRIDLTPVKIACQFYKAHPLDLLLQTV